VKELAGVQRHLLEAAADVVKPGGLLVYSTCTLEPEENEEQVGSFLRRRPEFGLESCPGMSAGLASRVDSEGHLMVLPQATGFDGAFAARMRRCA
jgi:16S rRNA (cytosine967-C5)-methyltransferase